MTTFYIHSGFASNTAPNLPSSTQSSLSTFQSQGNNQSMNTSMGSSQASLSYFTAQLSPNSVYVGKWVRQTCALTKPVYRHKHGHGNLLLQTLMGHQAHSHVIILTVVAMSASPYFRVFRIFCTPSKYSEYQDVSAIYCRLYALFTSILYFEISP
jgi:hypothetical protein